MTTIISENPSSLFNECIPVSLVTAGRNQESIACAIDVNLKIGERRLDNNERELRLEVSRPDEFEFLYAEGITRQKYARLAETWNLNVDFDDFPKRIIRLVRERDSPTCPVQINCILTADQNLCTLELIRHIDVQTVKIALELRKVTGEELMCHAMTNLRVLKKQVTKLGKEKTQLESENERREAVEREYEEYREQMERERQELQRKLKEEVERREELQNDMQLEVEEKQTANLALDDLRQDINHLEEEKEELENDLEVITEEYDELEREMQLAETRLRDAESARVQAERELEEQRGRQKKVDQELRKVKEDLYKAKEIIRKYVQKEKDQGKENTRPDMPSMDERKLNELREDIKEKEGIIERLSETVKTTGSREEALLQENDMLRRAVAEYQAKELERQKLVNSYALRQHQVPTTPGPGTMVLQSPATTMHMGYGSPSLPFKPVLGGPSRFVPNTPLRNSPQGMGLRFQGTQGGGILKDRTPFDPPTRPNV